MEKNKFKEIYEDSSEMKIWEFLDNGCFIGTLGYSPRNVLILQKLLLSFAEQYGEKIDYDAALEELMLYAKQGKLFIYFDQDMQPVSMNGCVYDYDNETVEFLDKDTTQLKSLYFYGLSTIHEYRGKGACRTLIKYAINYAKANGFDYVYARTDLVNSNSEWLMAKAGLQVCTFDEKIIAEWVPVTEEYGDYRLHMWLPLHEGLVAIPKGEFVLAHNDKERKIISDSEQMSVLNKFYSTRKIPDLT